MADNITKPVEGSAFLEFELKLPAQTISYLQQVEVPETHRITETVFDYNTADISFRVPTTQFLDRVLKALDANGEPIIRWRMGLGEGQTIQWIPWQVYYVYKYSAFFEGVGNAAGHFIVLYTRDLLHKIDRASKTGSHRGSISTIVRGIATDNNLADAVIEDTQGDAVWVQSYEGDFEFVRSRLLKRARSQRGRGNYYLYIRDNVLHFHTVEYQTKIKDMDYYLSPSTKLEAIDLAQAKIDAGAAGARVIYYDPYTGDSKEINSDPNKAIRMGNTIPRLDKIFAAQRNIREHKVHIRDEDAGSTALAQNAYEFARSESFALKMMTSKTFYLRPGELLRINIDPNAGNTSSWSGIYLVATASHVIEHNELNSVYILQRGELKVARSTHNALASYGVDSLQDEQNAPGYDLNVRDAQASSVTKGAGKESTGGAYLTVQDRKSAPTPQSQSGS